MRFVAKVRATRAITVALNRQSLISSGAINSTALYVVVEDSPYNIMHSDTYNHPSLRDIPEVSEEEFLQAIGT